MKAIRIDFSVRPEPWRWLGYGGLLLVLLCTAWEGRLYMQQSRELDQWNKLAADARQRSQRLRNQGRPALNAAQRQAMETELSAAARVISRISLPWDALFAQLESVPSADVTLLGIEPDAQRMELHVTAEAKSLPAMLDYARALAALPMLAEAYVTNHQVQGQDVQRPVRFVIAARWVTHVVPDAVPGVVSNAAPDAARGAR